MQTYKHLSLTALALVLSAGCALFNKRHDSISLRIHEQVSAALPEARVRTAEIPRMNLTIPVNPYPTLSEKDLLSASVYETAGGTAILLRFDIHGAIALDEMTTRCRGQYLVVFLDERPVAAWLVDRRLTDGQFLLDGDFTDEEARRTVVALNNLVHCRK